MRYSCNICNLSALLPLSIFASVRETFAIQRNPYNTLNNDRLCNGFLPSVYCKYERRNPCDSINPTRNKHRLNIDRLYNGFFRYDSQEEPLAGEPLAIQRNPYNATTGHSRHSQNSPLNFRNLNERLLVDYKSNSAFLRIAWKLNSPALSRIIFLWNRRKTFKKIRSNFVIFRGWSCVLLAVIQISLLKTSKVIVCLRKQTIVFTPNNLEMFWKYRSIGELSKLTFFNEISQQGETERKRREPSGTV